MEFLHKDNESDKPVAVILTAKWGTECHILYIHSLCVGRLFKIMEELKVEPDSLAEYLLPSKTNRNLPYEAKAEGILFVGFPNLIENTTICIGITWILDGDVDKNFIHSYQQLSKRLCHAISIEENRSPGLLQKEIESIVGATPKYSEEIYKNSFQVYFNESILKASSFARTLKDVYNQIWHTGLVHTFVNNNVELGFVLAQSIPEFTLNVPNIACRDINELMRRIRPYHTIVLMKDIMPSLDCSPLIDQLVRFLTPEKSFNTVATERGISIGQIFLTIRNLLTWVPCSIIYPICMNNVYTSSLHLNYSESLLQDIAKEYEGVNIYKIIAAFSPPCTLRDFLSANADENTGKYDLKSLFICLLKYRFIVQLHDYYVAALPFSDRKPLPPQDTVFYKELEVFVNKHTTLASEFTPFILEIGVKLHEEQDYDMNKIKEIMRMFFSISKHFNEPEHLEGIIFRTGLLRETVLRILDFFKDIICSYCTTNLIP
uniref:GATOR complex protein NPRL3 n=1 Tax=Strongyloides papillosus TaxID=174720 RepID=A0A0N5CER6_STREA